MEKIDHFTPPPPKKKYIFAPTSESWWDALSEHHVVNEKNKQTKINYKPYVMQVLGRNMHQYKLFFSHEGLYTEYCIIIKASDEQHMYNACLLGSSKALNYCVLV